MNSAVANEIRQVNKEVVSNISKEMLKVLGACRYDINIKEANELKDIIEEDSQMLSLSCDIRCLTGLNSISERLWLFEYKGRGYVLADISNGHYEYVCTVEEYMLRLRCVY